MPETDTDETGPEFEHEQASVERAMTDLVTAHAVDIRQGVARAVRAREVAIRQGVAGTVDADTVELSQAAVGLVRAGDVTLGAGSRSAGVLADAVTLQQSSSQVVVSRDSVEMDQSAAAFIVGRNITAKNSVSMIMVADTVEGAQARVIVNRQSAVAFGAAMGAALAVVLFALRLFKRR